MKIALASLVVCGLLAPVALVAADSASPGTGAAGVAGQSFEGRVTFRMTSAAGRSQEMRFAIKDTRSRVEIPNQQGMGAMIIDPTKREQIVLMDQQRMYLTMAMPDVAAAASTAKSEETTLTKTGETDKILGYTAEKYLATHKNSTTELWLAEGLGSFTPFGGGNPMAGGRGGQPALQGWERALAGKNLFPLRVISRDGANKETFRLEATSVEKQSLPDSLFAPPADYRKLDMGGMMNGAMPPGMGR